MPLRERLGEVSWLPLSVLLAVAGLLLVDRVLIPNRVHPVWVGVAGVALVLAVCHSGLARTDPVAFASIAAPSLILVVVGAFLPYPLGGAVALAAFVLLGAFAFVGDRFWPIWWHVVLRRPPLPVAWAFESEVRTHYTRIWQNASRTMSERQWERFVRSTSRDITHLRRLRAPDADWARYRDDLLEILGAMSDRGWDGTIRGRPAEEAVAELRQKYERLTRTEPDS